MHINLYFGSPSAILIQSENTASFARYRYGMQQEDDETRAQCQRHGLPCTASFVMADVKAQSKTMPKVMLGLYGYHHFPLGEPLACEYTTTEGQ